MKTALKIASLGAVSALSGLASQAYAQNSATATATGSATIIQSISISKTADLGFGTIVKPTIGTSTIVVAAAAGSHATVSGGNAVFTASSTSAPASFTVTGEGGSAISVTVPSTFNMNAGTSSLVVTTSNTGTTGNLSGSIGASGSFVVGVGGSFPLSSATASGAYSGNLVVSVAYN